MNRLQGSRTHRRISCLEKVPEDFFHGQIARAFAAPMTGLTYRANSLAEQQAITEVVVEVGHGVDLAARGVGGIGHPAIPQR